LNEPVERPMSFAFEASLEGELPFRTPTRLGTRPGAL
jgi:hypothetical protein